MAATHERSESPEFTEKLTGFLPCLEGDYPRARLQLYAFCKYRHPFASIVIACPDHQVPWFQEQVREFDGKLTVRVVSETDIVPELGHVSWVRGWVKQQLLKLAIAESLDTEFYVTLDADVTLRRDVAFGDFVEGGRGRYALRHLTPHMNWYRSSWRVLAMKARATQPEHNVTPAVLSRTAVAKLATFLDERARRVAGSWSPGHAFQRLVLAARQSRFPPGTRRWTLFLAAYALWPFNEWTEYSLYYCFLEEHGQIGAHHVKVQQPLYDPEVSIQKRHTERFARMDWDAVFRPPGETAPELPPFVIVQSVSQVPLETVLATFAPRVGAPMATPA